MCTKLSQGIYTKILNPIRIHYIQTIIINHIYELNRRTSTFNE